MGLFKRSSRSSHDPIEREAILAYVHALTRLAARQEESGEKYNRVLVAVGGSIASSPTDAASAASAAEAMSDAAASIKADHSALSPCRRLPSQHSVRSRMDGVRSLDGCTGRSASGHRERSLSAG